MKSRPCPGVSPRGTGLAALAGLAVLTLAGCSSKPAADSESGPSQRVVAYVANVSPTGEFCRLPDGCQFRLIDPRTGASELVFPVAGIPHNVFWDRGFTQVLFRLGAKLYRAAWRKGAEPELLLDLPEVLAQRAETIEDIWQDATTKKWRIKSLEYEGEGAARQAIAGVWEWDETSKQWTVLDKQPTECECGDCPCAAIMNKWLAPAPRVSAREVLDDMGIEWHLERSRPGEQWSEGAHGFISMANPNASYELQVVQGDTYHAVAPVKVDIGNGSEPLTVLPTGGPCGDQLAFMEDEGFLLLAAEYSGGCARVVNLNNGSIVSNLTDSALAAVWVNRPPR